MKITTHVNVYIATPKDIALFLDDILPDDDILPIINVLNIFPKPMAVMNQAAPSRNP